MARRDEDTEYQTYDKPKGKLLIDFGDKKKLMAEFSTFNDIRYWNARYWIQKRDGSWIRAKGLTLPPDKVREFHRALGDYIGSAGRRNQR